MEKDTGSFEDIARNKLAQAIDDLESADILLGADKYRAANNRAYYAIFYAIRAVLAMEEVDFKRHKDVLAYFNKEYVNKGIFPKMIGRKISQAQRIREDSDYDDEFVVNADKTLEQINTAEKLIELVEQYINK